MPLSALADGAAAPALEVAAAAPQPVEDDAPADLDVHGLSKAFERGKRPVLRDVTFSVGRGQAVALIGGNGTGKSTLMRCCLRVVEPDGGHISLLGRDVRQLRGRQLRRLRAETGFVFQRHNLVPRVSALTNVIHGALGAGAGLSCCTQATAPLALRRRAMDCLAMVGIEHLAAQRADLLSGGESQRVAIARALMRRPKVIFADEPVASLDPNVGDEVMSLFLGLIRREGLTLLFTCHNLDHARHFADRIIGLREGRIALDLPAATAGENDLRHVYA